MISLWPRTILQLTVTGFLMVTGLLLIALIITAQQLDGLSDQSQRIVSQSASATNAGRTLIEQITAMERNARQFSIVGDEDILRLYSDRRLTFLGAAQELRSRQLSTEIDSLIDELVTAEDVAFNFIKNQSEQALQNENTYPLLTERANSISDRINDWTNLQLVDLRLETEDTQRLLTIEALFLVSAAIVLAGFFTARITSPLLQIEKAIGQLGRGSYHKPINITGPRDLISLGGRLDWLRSRLGKLEQQRSSFLRHVSHELKTPLTAIQESASLLNDGVVGNLNSDQKDIIRIQNNNCQRLRNLIDDLLRHNSESFSVLNTMPEPVRLNRVINKVIEAHELIISSSGLDIELNIQNLTVNGDKEQIRVIFDNLLANAIKYSPDRGKISIQLHQVSDKVVFEITDQGPGIGKDESDKIFEAFYQGQPPAKKIYMGSGLGLAIAQEYVNANAGTIEVMNHIGGAHFKVCFPYKNASTS